jgi:hypothetical protein
MRDSSPKSRQYNGRALTKKDKKAFGNASEKQFVSFHVSENNSTDRPSGLSIEKNAPTPASVKRKRPQTGFGGRTGSYKIVPKCREVQSFTRIRSIEDNTRSTAEQTNVPSSILTNFTQGTNLVMGFGGKRVSSPTSTLSSGTLISPNSKKKLRN